MDIVYNNIILLGFLAPGACASAVLQMQKGHVIAARVAAVFAFFGGISLSIGYGLLTHPYWYISFVILLYAALVAGALALGKYLRSKGGEA